jgi:hypothetical protein
MITSKSWDEEYGDAALCILDCRDAGQSIYTRCLPKREAILTAVNLEHYCGIQATVTIHGRQIYPA